MTNRQNEQHLISNLIHDLDEIVRNDYYARRAAQELRIELIAMYVIAGEP